MGFESSHMARRRLASLAMSNRRVNEALAVASLNEQDHAANAAGELSSYELAAAGYTGAQALALELETLAQDIANTPGAGGALLASFAEQTRVLQMVAQASQRSPGQPLPADVLQAVQDAVRGAVMGSVSY